MAGRQPYKPVVIDKKLGDIYFTDKCRLYGPFAAPKTNPITLGHAEEVARKCAGKGRKPLKIKIVCLVDSLAMLKKSRISKKPPYARIKYADVKQSNLFPAFNQTVVICTHIPGKTPEYMAIILDQPLKANQLYDKLDYAALAPKNNLKNKIPEPEPSPPISPPQIPTVRPPSPAVVISPVANTSSSSSLSRSSSGVQINEQRPLNQLSQASEARNQQTPDTASGSRVAGLPRQQAYSPSLSPPSSRPSSRVIQPQPLEPSPILHQPSPVPQQPSFQPQPSPVVELIPRTPEAKPIFCDRCKASIQDANAPPMKVSPMKRSRSRQSESPTSIESRHTLTTDASSHYVLDEEKRIFEEGFSRQIVSHELNTRARRSGRAHSTSSSSSSSTTTRRKRHSKKRSRTASFSSSQARSASVRPRVETIVPCEHGHQYASPKMPSNRSQSLFILASGQFKPFSELAQEQDDNQGMCSICGEVRNGGPRQVEIIRTDGHGGPYLSEDGTIYMYSKTRPVDTNIASRERSRNSRKNAQHSRSRNTSTSSSSSSTSRSRSASARNGYAVPVKRNSNPVLFTSQAQPQRDGREQYFTGQGKKIYRLESNDSTSSSESSLPNTAGMGKIKVIPLQY